MMTDIGTRRGAVAIAAAFAAARAQGRSALVTYLMAGFPSPEASPDLFVAMQRGGADLIELGMPYSDPVADGPVIQHAGQVALQAGMTPRGCLRLVAALRERGVGVPLLMMGYYNPIHSYGPAFARDCAAVGVDGLIIPDLPPEEAGALAAACHAAGLALVYLVAPTSGEERIAMIAAQTTGFLYVVSRLGITGSGRPAADLSAYLGRVRQYAGTPVAIGFGISSPEHVRSLAGMADGLIVGSAIVERASHGPPALAAYVTALRAALGT
jgi:tryptophan synthase alpha subunit